MDEKCKGCDEKQACVPFFVHEDTIMHFSRVNKRMIVLFAIWSLMTAILVGIFVYGNTVREKQLIDMIDKRITEVENGVHQQSDP